MKKSGSPIYTEKEIVKTNTKILNKYSLRNVTERLTKRQNLA